MVSLLFLKVQIGMHVLCSHLIIPGLLQISLNMTNHQCYQALTLTITKPIFRRQYFGTIDTTNQVDDYDTNTKCD